MHTFFISLIVDCHVLQYFYQKRICFLEMYRHVAVVTYFPNILEQAKVCFTLKLWLSTRCAKKFYMLIHIAGNYLY